MYLFILIITLLCLFVIMIVILGQFFNLIVRGHPPLVSTSRRVIKAISEEVHLDATYTFYELGAGKSRLLRELAMRYPLAQYVGIEYAYFPYLLSCLNNRLAGRKIIMRRQNFFKADISQADYIYCYLLPATMRQLEEKFRSSAKPGATVISLNFRLAAEAFKTITVSRRETLYFYKM